MTGRGKPATRAQPLLAEKKDFGAHEMGDRGGVLIGAGVPDVIVYLAV